MRRGLTALLTGLLCVALTACSTIPEGMEEGPASTVPSVPTQAAEAPRFVLGCMKGDVLNPYTAKSAVNRSLSSLLYESLYVLDEDLKPVAQLAGKVTDKTPSTTQKSTTGTTVGSTTAATQKTTAQSTAATTGTTLLTPQKESTAPTEIRISLRKNAKFSNGKAVTGADVEASFRLAQKSTRFKQQLSNVASLQAEGERSVLVKLKTQDIRYTARLTFPIVSAATAEKDIPVGSGPYYANKKGTTLLANPHAAEPPALSSVTLKKYKNSDALRHALGTGQTVLYYDDLSSGEIPRVTTASSPIATSYLVFLGMNAANASLTPEVRTALSEAISRTELVNAAFAGYAEMASTPFHPRWPGAKKTLFSAGSKTAKAMKRLESAGYRTAKGSENRKELALSLLVSEENAFRVAAAEQLAAAFEAVGVTVTVTKLPFADYMAQLEAGDYDLYLGEVRLTDDMDLTPLLAGAASYGVKSRCAEYYDYYRQGTVTADAFLNGFKQELPFLPLCYRTGLVAYHRQLQNVRFSGFDLFSHIQDWTIQE